MCQFCQTVLEKRAQQKYCSNKCQADKRYSDFKNIWLDSQLKILTVNVSRHIRRYLTEEYGEECSECGWHKRHSITGKVPLEVDHIDGDSRNHELSNVRLICPNCHSLTESFRNLNKGNGRTWRKNTYVKKNK